MTFTRNTKWMIKERFSHLWTWRIVKIMIHLSQSYSISTINPSLKNTSRGLSSQHLKLESFSFFPLLMKSLKRTQLYSIKKLIISFKNLVKETEMIRTQSEYRYSSNKIYYSMSWSMIWSQNIRCWAKPKRQKYCKNSNFYNIQQSQRIPAP